MTSLSPVRSAHLSREGLASPWMTAYAQGENLRAASLDRPVPVRLTIGEAPVEVIPPVDEAVPETVNRVLGRCRC